MDEVLLNVSENNKFIETFTLTNQFNNKLILDTENTFIDKNIELFFNVQSGSIYIPTTTITAIPTISISSNGTIIASNTESSIIAPIVSASGWIDSGDNGTITISGTATYPIPLGNLSRANNVVYAKGYFHTTASVTIPSGQVGIDSTNIIANLNLNNSITNNSYVISVSATQTIYPIVTTAGYITNADTTSNNIDISGQAFLEVSTLSATAITPSPTTTATITVGTGYYHTNRTITINPMSAGINAQISSSGAITTTPTVTISGTCTMAVSAETTPYYFTRTGSASNGVVQTKYSNTTAGYVNAFSTTNGDTVTVIPTKTADATIYIPAATTTSSFSGGEISFTNNSNNIELSNSDTDNNNVKISLRATRAATSLTNTITAGYIPATAITASYTSTYTDGDYYVKGITLAKPSSGTATFYLTFPNGDDDTMTFHFEIDTNGNVTIS